MSTPQRRALILLASLIVTFVALRVSLYFSPDSDFNVGAYNIHHLYTGLIFVTLGGIPLALFPRAGRALDLAALSFGAGLSMALDEWVYLIATDGSNAAYLLPVSFWGGVIAIALTCTYVLVLIAFARSRGREDDPTERR